MSIFFGYCAVVANMPAWHVLAQVVLSMIFLACALSYLLVTTSVWMWWILVTVGLAALALLLVHHIYMSIVMLIFVHVALNELVDTLNTRQEVRHAKEIASLQTSAAEKAHRDTLLFKTNPEHHTSPWRRSIS
jgi:hypothetical protein